MNKNKDSSILETFNNFKYNRNYSKPKKLNTDSLFPSYTTTASETPVVKTPRSTRTNVVSANYSQQNSSVNESNYNIQNSSRLIINTSNYNNDHNERINKFSNR